MLPTKRPPNHPGEMQLKEFLEPMGLTQKEVSQHLSWTYARLNEIINKQCSVSVGSATSFAEALKTEPEFWLNLQRDWELWHVKKHHCKIKPLPLLAKLSLLSKVCVYSICNISN